MNFDEFRQVSRRTMRFTPEHRANAALGLVGELGEYLTPGENQMEEAGDALFYLAWLCEFYGITPTPNRDLIYDRLDMLICAASIADMVKKEVFHDKPVDREVMTKHLSDIYGYFYHNYGDGSLSNIYQANIAKLRLRHPIEKGYTNEGQNARADEIVKQCNPCACDRGGDIWHKIVDGYHTLACSYCGFGTCDEDLAMAIEKWNSINIDAPVMQVSDRGMNQLHTELVTERQPSESLKQAAEYSQSGNAEQTAAAYEATNRERFWRSLVKRVPELPADGSKVLLWWGEEWIEAECEADGHWYVWNESPDNHNIRIRDGQYWMPLPTFDPESE